MQILVNSGDVELTDGLIARVEVEVEQAMHRFQERVTRVEVHLSDENGDKGGVDKRCMMEVRLSGQNPLAVEHRARDLYEAITGAAGKLERAVAHRLERLDDLTSGAGMRG